MKTQWIAVGSLLIASLAGGATARAAAPAAPGVARVCGATVPGTEECLADVVINRPIASSDGTIAGYVAAQLEAAYKLPISHGAGQTIAIVDAFDDPTAESDLATYRRTNGLAPCTTSNGCFRKLNESGAAGPYPSADPGWGIEISLDLDMVSAACPRCHIVLVEANSENYDDLEQAEQAAVAMGATEISNSWGGQEPTLDSPAFDHPGIVITASSGDDGYRNWIAEPEFVNYPAASPNVVAVGGTRLLLNPDNTWLGEEVWNDGAEVEAVREEAGDGAGGSGCSERFNAPAWQRNLPNWAAVGCDERRAVADVSADADPFTGVAVYDSTESEGTSGWNMIGGTSVASPIIAAVFALAGGAHGVAYPARTLYENAAKTPASLHDVLSGSNGECLEPLDEESEPPRSGCSPGPPRVWSACTRDAAGSTAPRPRPAPSSTRAARAPATRTASREAAAAAAATRRAHPVRPRHAAAGSPCHPRIRRATTATGGDPPSPGPGRGHRRPVHRRFPRPDPADPQIPDRPAAGPGTTAGFR